MVVNHRRHVMRQINLSLGQVFFLLVVVGFLTFANSLRNPFMIDDHSFFASERMTDLKFLKYQLLPDKNKRLHIESGKTDTSYYRPLAHIIPMLNFWAFKNNVVGYHIFNLVLYIIGAFLFYLLLNNLLHPCLSGRQAGGGGGSLVALLAAMGYLVHPINGVVVNYITASVYAAQVIFMLLSLYLVSTPPPHREWRRLFAVGFFFLALLCHETSMALPFYAVVMFMTARRENIKNALYQSRWLWMAFGAYFIFRMFNNTIGGSVFSNMARLHVNGLEYLASEGRLMFWYLSKMIFPDGITLMWVTEPVRGLASVGWVAFLAGFVGFAIWALCRAIDTKDVGRRTKDENEGHPASSSHVLRPASHASAPYALGLAWLAIGFIPLGLGSVISPLQGFLIEPHWFVFPSTGFFIIAGAWLAAFWEKKRKPVAAVLIAAVLFSWMASSWTYNWIWGNEVRYCRVWLMSCPQFKAVSYFLGKSYLEKGQLNEAKYYFQNSLLHRYKDWLVYFNLGVVDIGQRHWQEASRNLQQALKLEPRAADPLNALGYVYVHLEKFSDAQQCYLRAIKADRFNMQSRLNLAQAYVLDKKFPEARKTFDEVLADKPCFDPAVVGVLRMAIAQKDREQTVTFARQAAACPVSPVTLTMAGSALKYYGFPNEAKAVLDKVIAQYPQFTDARRERDRLNSAPSAPAAKVSGGSEFRLNGEEAIKQYKNRPLLMR